MANVICVLYDDPIGDYPKSYSLDDIPRLECYPGGQTVTYCNSISVSEHVVMMILSLVRNYIPSYQWVVKGGWNIADCVARSYDLEGMQVGTVAAGRIGLAVLRRLA